MVNPERASSVPDDGLRKSRRRRIVALSSIATSLTPIWLLSDKPFVQGLAGGLQAGLTIGAIVLALSKE